MTLAETLQRASTSLEESGVRNPRRNAEILLECVLGVGRAALYSRPERALTPSEAEEYGDLLWERCCGRPLQHLTGFSGFMGLVLEVGEGVFIPRPETETVVERVLEACEGREVEVLDLGTGCGSIAISIACGCPGARITAVDVSEPAIRLCAANALRYGVEGRVTALHGDLYGPLPGDRLFDVIVSNPPYIPDHEWEGLDVEVRFFEPPLALLGEEDGMEVARRIIDGAPSRLKPGGRLFMELDSRQVLKAVSMVSSWGEVAWLPDLCGRPRVLEAGLK